MHNDAMFVIYLSILFSVQLYSNIYGQQRFSAGSMVVPYAVPDVYQVVFVTSDTAVLNGADLGFVATFQQSLSKYT
jgi:hypothetical protein